ncbi:MAG: spore cortex-lytic enzyme [Negativibacillus sp.]|nr:spore cortex-lytic enzyme [Negativibacillus sp.]
MIFREKASNLLRLATLMLINLCIVCLAFSQTSPFSSSSQPAVDVLSQYGSRGEEVTKIQTRLKSWGYFSGEVTGYYGSQTTEAVKRFQQKHGLSATGVADRKTLELIGISSSSSGASVSNADLELLARIISAEARGEPYIGQVAVGAVVLNRVESSSFPDSISGVVYQPGAFTAITDGQINEAVTDSARRAARDALNGSDPTGGALYYYNPDKTSNRWIRSRPVITRIGQHLFCS